MVSEMTESKVKLNPDQVLKEDYVKPNGLEVLIVPKEQFLEWFKHMKGIVGEIDIKIDKEGDWMECPNCKSGMENYTLNNDPDELWYLCPNCKLTFSQRQHQYFKRMMMRLVKGDFKRVESE